VPRASDVSSWCPPPVPFAAHLVMLTSRPESRLRAGNWRVLIGLDHHALVVVVHLVRPRGRV
jgi:hypothetical protein